MLKTRTEPRRWLPALALAFLSLPLAAAGAGPCPAGGLRVAIDVGHTKAAPGAKSATGKAEHAFNARFAEELIAASKEKPRLDLFVLTGSALTLRDRPYQAAQKGAHLFLSIHHDSVQRRYLQHWEHEGRPLQYSDVFKGYSLFVADNGAHFKESTAFAKLIGEKLRRAGFSPTLHHAEPIPGEGRELLSRELGVYAAPFAVLRLAAMPAVLFEVGIIVNRAEEKVLEDRQVRAKMQLQVLAALDEVCGLYAPLSKQSVD